MAGFLILPLLLYGPVTLGGRTMLPADNLFQWQPWAGHAAEFEAATPQNALLSDLILENYPWKRFIRESLQNRELPLWNPYLFAGAPFLANGQHQAYYPFSVLFWLLPLPQAYGWYTVSQLWLAGVFMYVFARVLGQRPASAAAAGLVFQGCGFMVVSAAVFPMILGAAVWLPLLLAGVERIIGRATAVQDGGKTLPWAALGAVALGCQILAGHIEITYYTLVVAAFYAVWRLAAQMSRWKRDLPATQPTSRFAFHVSRQLIKPIPWLAAMVAVGALLGGIQIVPLAEVVRANFREGSATLAQIQGWAFPWRRALTLALPDFYGNPADHFYRDAFTGQLVPFTRNYFGELNPHGAYSSHWGIKNYVEGGIYLGILPLILAGLGVWAAGRRPETRRHVTFFITLSLLSLAFIFGTPLYALLYYGLPGINQLHSPFRWVFPLSMCVAALAGYGMDALADRRRPTDDRFSSFVLLAGLLVLGGVALSWLFYGRLESLLTRLWLPLAQAADAFPHARAFYSYTFWQVLHLGLALVTAGAVLKVASGKWQVASGGRRSVVGGRFSPLVALVVIGLDLFLVGRGFNVAVEPAILDYKPELITWLEQQPGLWRLTTFTPHGDKPLNANAPWLYDLQDARGYDSIILKQYTDYMAAIEPQKELESNRIQPIANWESLNSPLLDLLGVKYIVTAETLDLPKLSLAWEGEGLRVYENLAAAPRAFTLPQTATVVAPDPLAAMQEYDPRQYVIVEVGDRRFNDLISNLQSPIPASLAPAEITHYSNLEVRVDTVVSESSWLVLADTYFTGWKAFARPVGTGEDQEQEVAISRVDGNFRGVLLEAGSWTVRFRYSPLSFKLGGLASAMGVVVLVFALVVWSWRRLVNPEAELTNTRSIAKNSVAPMALNLFNRLIDFVYAAFYLRLLGPADAGRFATAIALAGWFEIVSNFGLNTLIIREVSQDKSQAGHYLFNTTVLRIGTSIVAGLPIFAYLGAIRMGSNPMDAETVAAILLFMVGMVFSGMTQGLTGLFYAFEMAERPAAIATVTTILKVGFGVVALLLGYGFVGLAAVSIPVNILTLAMLALMAFRRLPLPQQRWYWDWRLQREMVGRSYPLMLNHFFAVIFFQIDVPLLRQFNGETVVGWYNSAYKWVNAINVIPAFFTFALFPVISRQILASIDDARRAFRMSIKLMVLVALPVAALTTLLARPLIAILGGSAFLPEGAIALQIVIWSIPFGWINSVTNYVLIALGLERIQTRAFVIAVAFNLIANVIFLPRYSYVAAAVITIVSEMMLLAVFGYYLRQRMPGVGWLGLLWRPVVVGLFMVLLMVLANQVHPALALVVGLLAYPAGLWLLRVFGDEERRIVQSLLPRPQVEIRD